MAPDAVARSVRQELMTMPNINVGMNHFISMLFSIIHKSFPV